MPKQLKLSHVSIFKGEISVPADKSISHRAIMLGALANGETVIHNFLNSADCIATANCFKMMGIEIEHIPGTSGIEPKIVINGKGLNGLSEPNRILDVGNSGTTIRLLSGILAGQNFESEITGDLSIQKRPMGRIVKPLSMMGAEINGNNTNNEIYPPLEIIGRKLHSLEYKLPIASAQVKSCILLAGLYADGVTTIIEQIPSRDHTERMLAYFGANLTRFGSNISLKSGIQFEGREVFVPADISSAAYFMVAGVLIPNSDILIRNVGVNPTRDGIFEVLHRMGAGFRIKDEEVISGEPRANIELKNDRTANNNLKGIEIGGELIPRIIDEIPIIAILATQAQGLTVIKNAKELRVKESDRIKTISSELRKMGAKIEEQEDGMIIYGPTKLKGTVVQSYKDHRIAMSMAIAGLVADGETTIEDVDCIDTSFPGFESKLKSLIS